MNRKFSELTASEQVQFQNLVDFMKETKNEDVQAKLNVIQKFSLDLKDPVVYDFFAGRECINPNSAQVPAVSTALEQTLPAPATNSIEMTYANSQDLIVIQNRLLHAISDLTLNERRLILFLSPIVRKQIETMSDDRIFYVSAIDFSKEYKLKGKSVYRELEKTADSIVKKAFFFWVKRENGKNKKAVSWVSECEYLDNEGRLKIRLDNTVIEMLTVFDKTTGYFWTQYQKEWVVNLGAYGIIMLEMVLSSIENKGYYTVEHLREKFNCVELYPVFADFKRYVIDKAIKEIHDNTPLKIDYQLHKNGKATTGLTFSYVNNMAKSINDDSKESQKTDKTKYTNPFTNFKMSQKQLSLFASKIKQATGQSIDEIISELCNVHLQSKHINFLKVLDYVPSEWYSDEEIQSHPTPEQIHEMMQQKQKSKNDKSKLDKEQLLKDYEKLKLHAQDFVMANTHRVNSYMERMYLENQNYAGIVDIWKNYLINAKDRRFFNLVEEILAR